MGKNRVDKTRLRAPSLDALLVLDILRTHPVAVIGGALLVELIFSRPEDFLGKASARGSTALSAYRGDRRQ